MARRYDRHGLNPTQQRIVDFLTGHGIEGASILEIGGGLGEIQVELLRRGAAHVTNTEISTGYEDRARGLLRSTGLEEKVTRRIVDIAEDPDRVEGADVVMLHRVVCCYPDYQRLLTAAGEHARRLVVFSHPPANWGIRAMMGTENVLRRVRGNAFRSFVHPPRAMADVVESQGLRLDYEHRGMSWNVLGFARPD
jgi:magnesium-protoporphyrin O-methyltransferase